MYFRTTDTTALSFPQICPILSKGAWKPQNSISWFSNWQFLSILITSLKTFSNLVHLFVNSLGRLSENDTFSISHSWVQMNDKRKEFQICYRFEKAFYTYPIMHLDWGSISKTFNSPPLYLGTESKVVDTGLRPRCIMGYVQI